MEGSPKIQMEHVAEAVGTDCLMKPMDVAYGADGKRMLVLDVQPSVAWRSFY